MTLLPSITMCVIVIYRPPSVSSSSLTKVIEFINDGLESHVDDTYQICLAGDLNFPYIDWSSASVSCGTTTENQKSATDFVNFLSGRMLNQYMTEIVFAVFFFRFFFSKC